MSVTTAATPANAWKKAILRAGIGFMVLMLLLTFFSGTLNNIALANVSVVSPSSAALQKVITADGKFSAKKIVDVNVEVAGKVSEVLVKEGDIVRAGDVLVKMDMSELQDQITTEKNSLTRMLNNREKSQLTVTPDYTQMTIEKTNAWNNYVKARDAYDALTKDPAATQEQLDAAKQQKTDAYNDYKVKKAQLEQQKKQDANQKKGAELDLINTDLEIDAQKAIIAELEEQIENNAEIKAKVDGRIETINVEEGSQATTNQPLMTMLDTAKGLEFSVDLSNDNAGLMAVGGVLDIHLAGSSDSVSAVIREKVNSTANPGQMMTILLDADLQDVLEHGVQPNQQGDIRYTSNTQSYGLTLPNSAIREDSSGYFVLVVKQQKTPLGNSLALSRVDVSVLDSDSYRTAVSGALSMRDQVVSNSDKSVADGDTVRLAS
jgi:HlyD family secretion protein